MDWNDPLNCPDCRRTGTTYCNHKKPTGQLQARPVPRATSVLQSPAENMGTGPDPDRVAGVLKIVLYVGVAAALWAAWHYYGPSTGGAGENLLEQAAGEYSLWEPKL